ncbi:MAG: SDR family NAD(P)-dependent oxidoreductase [Acidimicrobiales bacterium]
MGRQWRVDLSGKVALVTGATRGLGRTIALGFAASGAEVVVVSRKLAACEELTAVIEGGGGTAFPYACHMGDWDAIEGLVEASYDRFGRIDVLVNNAGIAPRYSSLVAVDEDLYDKVLDVNLKGPFRLSTLVGARMAASGGGSIIQTSSSAARRPTMDVAPYAAAKAGLEALTAALAEAYGPRVRVNCIQCGVFHTDATAVWSRTADFEASARRDTALGRAAEPGEIVGTVLYLASDASSFTTGAVLRVDGGRF